MEQHYDLRKLLISHFCFLFSNVACRWLNLSNVGLSSTTVIRRLVSLLKQNTKKKCCLSFSSGRKQVLLKNFTRLFHRISPPSLNVVNSFVKETVISPDGPPTSMAAAILCDFFFFFHQMIVNFSYTTSGTVWEHQMISSLKSTSCKCISDN